MHLKKVFLPLVMLLAAPLVFAQNDGPEPDWNNPDEVGNVFVCLDKENTGAQSQGEWDCLHGVWFTVDMVPDGKDDWKADPVQVKALTSLVEGYQSVYKVASYVKAGEKFAVKNKHIYLYRLPSADFKLVAQQTTEVFGSRVFFKAFETEGASYLVVLPRLEHDLSGQVSLYFEDGMLLAKVAFFSAPEDNEMGFILPEFVVMEPFANADAKQWRQGMIKRHVSSALQQNSNK